MARALRQFKTSGKLDDCTVMAFLLILLAGTMLARMPLFPRIYHLGFFQAALAGMVIAAFIVAELPRWTGAGRWGRCAATAGALTALTFGCVAIALKSGGISGYETEPVGSGRDRFYAFAPDVDGIGAVVNWTVEQLRDIPPQTTVLALPEGLMVNYLSRHVSPLPTWNRTVTEEAYVKQLQATPPDYVVLISRDLREFGTKRFGDEGNPGHLIMQWVGANYWLEKDRRRPLCPRRPKRRDHSAA